MSLHLPQYIINCFIEAGFDSIHNISAIDDNSISEIEKYIDKRKKHLPSCMRSPSDIASEHPFCFPPGHIVTIKKFVEHLSGKSEHRSSVNSTKPPPSKKGKFKPTPEPKEPEPKEDVSLVTSEIRKKVIKWSRDYDNGESEFAHIVEGSDFSIKVSRSTTNPSICEAVITCSCGRSIAVTKKPSGERIISNWIKHVKACKKKSKRSSNQISLQSYFVPIPATVPQVSVPGSEETESTQSLLPLLDISPLKEISMTTHINTTLTSPLITEITDRKSSHIESSSDTNDESLLPPPLPHFLSTQTQPLTHETSPSTDQSLSQATASQNQVFH